MASRQLATLLENQSTLTGTLYIGYPIIGTSEGAYTIDALLLSPEKGIVVFHIVEGKDVGDYRLIQDEHFAKMHSKLYQHTNLVKNRGLAVLLTVITFAPAIQNTQELHTSDHPVCSSESIIPFLNSIEWNTQSYFAPAAEVIQSISNIRKYKKRRIIQKPESRGSKLKRLEESIANLDNQQGMAVIETVEGVQRIRGLAGSGKTIVLALKVAYLHAIHPDWKIAITFNTRSLKNQFERLINTFVIEQTGDEPDWDNIEIIHAWGAPGGKERDGMYFRFCAEHGVTYYDFRAAMTTFGPSNEFEGACRKALNEVKDFKPQFDIVLIDEAQDFSPHFLLMCYELVREPKRLVYAYDELQSLTMKSLPSPEEIFGKNSDGTSRVRFVPNELGKPKQDIVLQKCYRNSRPILTTAHALGFGLYRKAGLIQMFENKELWSEIGYLVISGSLEDGQKVILGRTNETSPDFLENHSTIDDIVQFHSFSDAKEQNDWIVNEIERTLKEDELDADDIMVINPDPISTREAVADARSQLNDRGINTVLAGVSTSPDVFNVKDAVTFTGIFRAKGNEAALVYVINAQDCFTGLIRDLAKLRNQLFTAMTRSKAWVRVCGHGPNMIKLAQEFEDVKSAHFKLDFRYPTEEERKRLRIINKDLSEAERHKLNRNRGNLKNILESLEKGDTLLEDFPPEVIKKLKAIFDKSRK